MTIREGRGNVPIDTYHRLLGHFVPDVDRSHFDADGPLDCGIAQILWSEGDLRIARRGLADLLTGDISDSDLAVAALPWIPLPAGRDHRVFLEYCLRRVDEAIATGTWTRHSRTIYKGGLAHRSRFVSREVSETAVRDVLRTHEHRFRSWVADQGGTPRLHLVADLGRPIGTVQQRDLNGDPVGDPIRTSTCAVLLRVDPDTGRPIVMTSYPEPPVDEQTRRRYPDLVGLFGGYFGQDVWALDYAHWWAEHRFHNFTAPEVIARVIDQLDALLRDCPATQDEEDEQVLRAAVHDLGSCANPEDFRVWVRLLRRRAVELVWTPPHQPLGPQH